MTYGAKRYQSMGRIKFFLLGIAEFRLSLTTAPPVDYIDDYDLGREIAHVLTFRIFENV